jgi:hypothetical protein
MNRTFRMIALFASGMVLLSFVILVVNQTAQVVQLATTIHPVLGKVTLISLLVLYGTFIGVPVVLVLRLPSPLAPPESEESPAFEEHLQRLGQRLSASPHTAGHDLSRRQGIEEALGHLAGRSDQVIRDAATAVFLSTAVSQSGRLDALIVILAQSRMVWRIAHIYYQRPSLRDMIHLYANVAGTAFVAGELQDLDLGHQVEPIVSAAVSAVGASVPGLHVAGTILAGCILDGSANAFLTLRVGMIAKRYCGALVVEPKGKLCRAATAEAARHLGAIVADGSARLTKAIWKSSVGKVGGAVSGATGKAKDAGAWLMSRVRGGQVREDPELS